MSETLQPMPLSVPSAKLQALLERWRQHSQQWEADVAYHKRPIFKDDPNAVARAESCQARVSSYAVCIRDLYEVLAAETLGPEPSAAGLPERANR